MPQPLPGRESIRVSDPAGYRAAPQPTRFATVERSTEFAGESGVRLRPSASGLQAPPRRCPARGPARCLPRESHDPERLARVCPGRPPHPDRACGRHGDPDDLASGCGVRATPRYFSTLTSCRAYAESTTHANRRRASSSPRHPTWLVGHGSRRPSCIRPTSSAPGRAAVRPDVSRQRWRRPARTLPPGTRRPAPHHRRRARSRGRVRHSRPGLLVDRSGPGAGRRDLSGGRGPGHRRPPDRLLGLRRAAAHFAAPRMWCGAVRR